MSDIFLTQEELDAMPQKTKKHQHIMDLYLKYDFKTAYAMHTDDRVKAGYEGAIGAADQWEERGEEQAHWLKKWGLRPEHKLLDFGCGTGRLARKIVPYLHSRNYYGYDLSLDAIFAAEKLAQDEGWYVGEPTFVCGLDEAVPKVGFDFGWAFSVFIHNPYEVMVESLQEIASAMAPDGKFYFSWTNEPYYVRSGLKQFRHTRENYESACKEAGLKFEWVEEWLAPQKVAVATHR
jgi:SAM-dependent methyltransferase